MSITPIIWVGPVAEREAIMDASVPRGEQLPVPFRQFPSHFGFVRINPPEPERRFQFDSDSALRRVIQLSRLVRPTNISTSYAARVTETAEGRMITPCMARGIGTVVFTSRGGDTMLWDEDIVELRRLVAAFRAEAMPTRVLRSMWFHEYLFSARYIEVRFPHLITALEALIHTDERGNAGSYTKSTEQFVKRLAKLKSLVPGLPWSESDLEDAYNYRSGLVHGRMPGEEALQPAAREVYDRIEDGLRLILVQAILRPDVAEIFSVDQNIRTYLT
jgi:hypothetical protein